MLVVKLALLQCNQSPLCLCSSRLNLLINTSNSAGKPNFWSHLCSIVVVEGSTGSEKLQPCPRALKKSHKKTLPLLSYQMTVWLGKSRYSLSFYFWQKCIELMTVKSMRLNEIHHWHYIWINNMWWIQTFSTA